MAKLSEVEKELADTQRKLSAAQGGESSRPWRPHRPPQERPVLLALSCVSFAPLRLRRLFRRGPAGCFHDRSAKRGGHGRRGAQEAPPARGRLAQRRSEAPQAGGAHTARPDALTAAEVGSGTGVYLSGFIQTFKQYVDACLSQGQLRTREA